MFTQYIISKITNHFGWIDYHWIFGSLTVFVWKIWIGVGAIIRKITIFLLLNKCYEILLSSVSEAVTVWARPAGFFSSAGDGLEVVVGGWDAVHISWLMNLSKQRWTLRLYRHWWSNTIHLLENIYRNLLVTVILPFLLKHVSGILGCLFEDVGWPQIVHEITQDWFTVCY